MERGFAFRLSASKDKFSAMALVRAFANFLQIPQAFDPCSNAAGKGYG